MAIQVSGTEVISNSRVISNVTGFKTVSGNSILGSGDIAVGASTAVNGVGTYTIATNASLAAGGGGNSGYVYKEGYTTAGSNLKSIGFRWIYGVSTADATNPTISATSTSGSGTGTATGANNGSAGYGMASAVTSNQAYSGSWRLMTPTSGVSASTTGQQYNWWDGWSALYVRYA